MARFKQGASGNPKGRKPKSARLDGWASVLTGLGTDRDKRTSVFHCVDTVTDIEARELWRGDDLAARAVESYPDEMLRAGYDVSVQAEDDDAEDARETAEAVEEELKRLGADEAFRTALCFERAYGGGAILPIINDSVGDLARPLDETRIPEIRRLVVFEPRELQALTYYTDPFDEKYGMPETYSLQPIGVLGSAVSATYKTVHESRLIVFPGKQVSRAVTARVLPGWGDSVLTLVRDTIRDFNAGFGSINHLLQDFSQAIFAIRGLHDAVAADQGQVIKNRVIAMDVGRSVLRALMLDAGGDGKEPETFQRASTPLTGVSEVMDRMIYRLASALEMPASMLLGMPLTGLNPTGDGEIRMFYDRVSQKQDRHLRPRLERLVELVFLSKMGPTSGAVPDKWCVEFCPLWQPSEKERTETRKVQAEIDKLYFDMGLPLEDILHSRFSGDGYSFETKVDFDTMQRVVEQETAAKAAADAARRVAPAPGDDVVPPEVDDQSEE